MLLEDFIRQAQGHWHFRSHLREPGFSCLYVRYTKRYILGAMREPVFDIASVDVVKKGQGTFTSFFNRLRSAHPELYIFVENVLNPRFEKKLESLGFQNVTPGEISPCFYLPPVNKH
jgi:hypothetical protein